MNNNIFGSILGITGTIIDKVVPDRKQSEEIKMRALELQQKGEFLPEENRYNAIVAEAKSSDPYTSRARPSFLYVIYIYILAAIPMGIVFAVSPQSAQNIANGVRLWLEAIPNELYMLFSVGYLGYTGARSFDKVKLLGKKHS